MSIHSNPVVLLHGMGDTSAVFKRLRGWLEERGRTTYAPDLIPRGGGALLEELSRQTAGFIDQSVGRDQAIDLVGFSMGGLVARYYVQRLGGLARTSHLITISSPHRGTRMAFLSRTPGVRQMRPGSEFLKDLDRDSHVLKRVVFTSIWTPWDLMIIPASSSVAMEARSIRVHVAAHPLMLRSRTVFRLIEQSLTSGGARRGVPRQEL